MYIIKTGKQVKYKLGCGCEYGLIRTIISTMKITVRDLFEKFGETKLFVGKKVRNVYMSGLCCSSIEH